MTRRIIVDCDSGVDDALALMLLIAGHKTKRIEILAINCVNGNTVLENVINNVFRTLQACDTPDIPVFKGAHCSFLATENARIAAGELYHGTDGFGDVYTDKPDIKKLKKEHAVCALNRITSENPGEISVVCLGPLTNIALAIRMFPEFISNIKDFYIMGGNYSAQGNVTAQAEFNFYADPESVHIVLDSNDKPLWLLPWETCLKSKISHEWRKDVFGRINTPVVKLINETEEGLYSKKKKPLHYTPCDGFIAGVVLKPEMAKDVVECHLDIELHGHKTRGQVVMDHLRSKKPNVKLIRDFDSEIFKELLIFGADPHEYRGTILEGK